MGGRVLAIDDSVMVLSYVEMVLTDGGHSVTVAEDWATARGEFRNNDPFHVILVDVNLPGMRSGDHLAKSLRMHPKAKDSKIVFFSAESDSHLDKLTQMSGMDGYITKGQGDDKFLQDVESYMPPSVLLEGTSDASGAGQPGAKDSKGKIAQSAAKPSTASKPAAKKSWWKR